MYFDGLLLGKPWDLEWLQILISGFFIQLSSWYSQSRRNLQKSLNSNLAQQIYTQRHQIWESIFAPSGALFAYFVGQTEAKVFLFIKH